MEKHLSYQDHLRVVRKDGANHIVITATDGEPETVEMHNPIGNSFQVETANGRATGEAVRSGNTVWVRWQGRTYTLDLDQGGTARKNRSKGGGDLSSPMPGQVIKLMVSEGATVEAGDVLLVVEAMKMQLEIKAPHAGVVTGLPHGEGDTVAAGELLAHLEASE